MYNIQLKDNKKAYFASDFHLGLPPFDKSREREITIIKWLDSIKHDAQIIFLLGDTFDFWYEYKNVVPKGFTRFLGKLSELCDNGIEVHLFTGNHDLWMKDYLPKEVGVVVQPTYLQTNINGSAFYLSHGDELGNRDYGFKLLKGIFKNKFLQFLFSRIHPNTAVGIGLRWSKHSRYSKGISETFLGEDKEHQILFAREILKKEQFNYFVFGHRHLPIDFTLQPNSRLINLGEWIEAKTYAVFDGNTMKLEKYNANN